MVNHNLKFEHLTQKNRLKGGFSEKGGPSDRIRTCGILLPKQARYQLRYTRLFRYFIRLVVFSQSKRATNCANPGFLGIQFCSRCGQTWGQAAFLTISACGGSACISGGSRNCGHSIFQLEGGATRSQTRRDTNFAIPGYLLFSMIPRRTVKIKIFLSVVIYVVKAAFCAAFSNRGKSRERRCRKALRRFALPCPGYRHGTPKASALPTALIPDMKFRLIRRPDVLTQECVCKWLRHRT